MKIKNLIMILFLLTLSIQNVSNVNAKECTEIYAASYELKEGGKSCYRGY